MLAQLAVQLTVASEDEDGEPRPQEEIQEEIGAIFGDVFESFDNVFKTVINQAIESKREASKLIVPTL